MKKLFVIVVFICCATFIKAQNTQSNVSISTLVFMLDRLSIENSDEYFSKKGYAFDGTHELKNGTMLTHYQHSNSSKTLSLGVLNESKTTAGLSTLKFSDYLSLLNEAKKAGYKYIKTITSNNNNATMFYSKGIYQIAFYKGINSSNKPTYLIELSYN